MSASRGLLRPAILLLLDESDDHGYSLMQRLSDAGLRGVDRGGMYRALRSLEEGGSVRSWWTGAERGAPRRLYALTAVGQNHLRQSVTDLVDQRDTVAGLLERAGRSGARHPQALGDQRLLHLASH